MSFEMKNIRSAIKYDIEISGPTVTICNVPINNLKPTESVMEVDVLREILKTATKEEVLLVNLVLNSFSDVFNDDVRKLIAETNRTVVQGIEVSISFPIDDAEVFIRNTEEFKKILLSENIDITHYFVRPEMFSNIGIPLGKFMKEMAFESIHDSKIHTLFPIEKATQDLFLDGLKGFINAADIWKTYRLEFINLYDLKGTKKFEEFINKMNRLAEITYSFLPTVPKSMLSEYDELDDFEIRAGSCLGGEINVAFDLTGRRKTCLQQGDPEKICYFNH